MSEYLEGLAEVRGGLGCHCAPSTPGVTLTTAGTVYLAHDARSTAASPIEPPQQRSCEDASFPPSRGCVAFGVGVIWSRTSDLREEHQGVHPLIRYPRTVELREPAIGR